MYSCMKYIVPLINSDAERKIKFLRGIDSRQWMLQREARESELKRKWEEGKTDCSGVDDDNGFTIPSISSRKVQDKKKSAMHTNFAGASPRLYCKLSVSYMHDNYRSCNSDVCNWSYQFLTTNYDPIGSRYRSTFQSPFGNLLQVSTPELLPNHALPRDLCHPNPSRAPRLPADKLDSAQQWIKRS